LTKISKTNLSISGLVCDKFLKTTSSIKNLKQNLRDMTTGFLLKALSLSVFSRAFSFWSLWIKCFNESFSDDNYYTKHTSVSTVACIWIWRCNIKQLQYTNWTQAAKFFFFFFDNAQSVTKHRTSSTD